MAQRFDYLATPYAKYPAGRHRAFVDASKAAAHLLRQGRVVFCPIAHFHPVGLYGGVPQTEHDIWIPADRPFMEAARELIVVRMEGWEDSFGIAQEIAIFEAAGKPIQYLDWPLA